MNTLKERLDKAWNEKNAVQRYLSRRISKFLQPLGFHLVGDHFYEPIPNTAMLKATYKDEPRKCLHIDFKFPLAEQNIKNIIERWGKEFYPSATRHNYQEKNYYFRGVDAIALYCFIRETKPSSIIEVGQGFSTRIIIAALEDNYRETGVKAKFISIDPYERLSFEGPKIVEVELKFISANLQEIATTIFSNLEDSDLLFIDSSHVYKFGSDVEYLFEEIYPSLRKGVYVHVHDICSPYHYPLDWYVKERRFWNEQYFLENFLRSNEMFEIELPIYYLIRESKLLREICNHTCNYEDFKFIGYSFFLKKTGD